MFECTWLNRLKFDKILNNTLKSHFVKKTYNLLIGSSKKVPEIQETKQ